MLIVQTSQTKECGIVVSIEREIPERRGFVRFSAVFFTGSFQSCEETPVVGCSVCFACHVV